MSLYEGNLYMRVGLCPDVLFITWDYVLYSTRLLQLLVSLFVIFLPICFHAVNT